MQHGVERALPHFLAQDRRDVVVGFARVDDQRQVQLAREGDLRAKHLRRDVGRRVIIVIVEPGLADADAFGMRGEGADRRGVGFRLFGRLMRMRADGEIDVGEALGDRRPGARLRDARRDRDQPLDARRARARATTASSSSAKSGKSRWQWLSISLMGASASGST